MADGKALDRAELLFDLGRYDDADPLLAKLLAAEPDNRRGQVLHIRGLLGRNRAAEAEAAARQLLSGSPDSVAGLALMARAQVALGSPRDALPYSRRAVELSPHDAQCLEELAEVLERVPGGTPEALALYERAIAADPGFARAHRRIGWIHLRVERYADAECAFRQALRIEPDNAPAVASLGTIAWRLGRLDESRELLTEALRLNPKGSFISAVIGDLEHYGLPGHLMEVYRMALAAQGLPDLSCPGAAGGDPELIAAQGKLAAAMYTREAGQEGKQRAGQLAAAVLDADPANRDARYVRARQLHTAGRNKEALSIARQLAAEGYPADPVLYGASLQLGDYASALRILEQADRQDHPASLTGRAKCLIGLKRYDEALQAAQRAAELSPSAPGVQLQLGRAAKGVGDLALADRSLRAARAGGDRATSAAAAAELASIAPWRIVAAVRGAGRRARRPTAN